MVAVPFVVALRAWRGGAAPRKIARLGATRFDPMAFARTKIQRPQRRPGTHIDRPALERQVGQALLTQRLVLLCAAAGFGKTSVLARQAELLPEGTALAWIACDEGDTPEQLFECLVDALEPFDPPWRTAPQALMRAAAEAATVEQRRAVAAEVINALDACEVEHGVIVIDDLHRIEHASVFAFLDDLLQRFTPRWTLAIATRHEPALALARLRASGELAEFRLDDLRFDTAEVQRLMGSAGLIEADAAVLQQRTQGWPVGLRLALNARAGPNGRRGTSHWLGTIDRHVFAFSPTK
jgi:LuxR family transcriptional regulator, maltose regulon positive regulatory protein